MLQHLVCHFFLKVEYTLVLLFYRLNTAKHFLIESILILDLLGRRRYLRDIDSRNYTLRGFAERNAINTPIQGSAADIIKLAMVKIYEWINQENLKSKMIMQVHDELVFDIEKEELNLFKSKVKTIMEGVVEMKVPLSVDVGVGKNWLEAH